MSVSNEVRSKVIAITGMEPVCTLSSHTVKEHLQSMLDDLWMKHGSDKLRHMQSRILQGSVAWCTWSDDDYKSLFDDIHEILNGSLRIPEGTENTNEVEYASLLPHELKVRLETFLTNNKSYNEETVTQGDALVEYARNTYSTKVLGLLEAIMGKALMPALVKHIDAKLESAVADMS